MPVGDVFAGLDVVGGGFVILEDELVGVWLLVARVDLLVVMFVVWMLRVRLPYLSCCMDLWNVDSKSHVLILISSNFVGEVETIFLNFDD